jgi:hypothetical protein
VNTDGDSNLRQAADGEAEDKAEDAEAEGVSHGGSWIAI